MPVPPFETEHGQVKYWEFVEGYRERWAAGTGIEVERVLFTSWGDRKAFAQALIGYSHVQNNRLSRFLPEPYPENDEVEGNLYCVEADLFQPTGAPDFDPDTGNFRVLNMPPTYTPGDTAPVFGFAFFRTIWRKLPFVVLADDAIETELDRYVTREYTFGTETQLITGNAFKWVDGPEAGKPIPAQVGRSRFLGQYTLTWHDVPCPDAIGLLPQGLLDNIGACISRVNDREFDGQPANTLLFLSPHVQRIESVANPCAFNIQYQFLFRPLDVGNAAGHLKLPLGNGFFNASVDGTLDTKDGNRIYDSADLNKLFRLN